MTTTNPASTRQADTSGQQARDTDGVSPAGPHAGGGLSDQSLAPDPAGGETVGFVFASVPFEIVKGPGVWRMRLRHADVPVTDVAGLAKLSFTHSALMDAAVTRGPDFVELRFEVDPGWCSWEELRARPRADKLRAMANLVEVEGLVQMGFGVILDPANLMFDRNLRPKLAYRGLAGVMPPAGMDAGMLLRQYQALTLALFDPKVSFASVFDGAMTLKHASAFDRAIIGADSPHALAAYLTGLFDLQVQDDARRLVRVPRVRHRLFKYLTIWLAVVAVAGMAGVGYYTFGYAPFQERIGQASTEFVKKDYDGLIETLRPVAIDRLPAAQRYELAYAYVQGTNLSDKQRATIMNNLSMNSDEEYLDYWIQVGRGQISQALDTAKGLDDLDLILYAITLSQDQVKNDTRMSGTDREAKLDQLQQDYDKYFKARAQQTKTGATPTPTGKE